MKLDKPHAEFLLRIAENQGWKLDTGYEIYREPTEENPYGEIIVLWKLLEDLDLTECVGSYKWVLTDKGQKVINEVNTKRIESLTEIDFESEHSSSR